MNQFTSKIKLFPEPVEGTVVQVISPRHYGRVKLVGSYWPARLYQPDCQVTLPPGESVTVVGREGLTMLVCPSQLT